MYRLIYISEQQRVTKLREDHGQLQHSVESLSSKLDRTTLQLEGARTKNVDLERANNELRRDNADARRQLERWVNLETKDDAEVKAQRERCMELEIYAEDLKLQTEKIVEEKNKALEKEKRKVEKLKKGIAEWQVP